MVSELTVAGLSLAACVFAASAAAKLRGRRAYLSFRTALGETALLSRRMLSAVAVILVAGEAVTASVLAAGTGLVTAGASGARPFAEVGLGVAVTLTGALTAGVAAVISRGARVPCACFGARTGRPIGPVHLLRNLGLLAILAVAAALNPLSNGPLAVPSAAVAASAGAILAFVFIHWEDLADLFAPVSRPEAGTYAARRPRHGSR